MKHYGDITKISGYEVPIVDVITGGSPCQDLSVAGKRAGLAGERSGLFMEQIRIVKEMRDRDVRENGRSGFLVRPRYMVWENVPGAFTSGNPKGSDFAAVIEEIIKVCEPNASMRVCVPDGGWTKSGCFYSSDGAWSIAWRVHDAQFWGVPQRRKRISLVADFGGRTAPEILFERKGLSRDSEPCGEKREEIAGATTESFGDASRNQVGVFDSNPEHSYGQFGDVCETIRSAYGTGGGNQPIVVEPILLESNQNHATVQTDGVSTALPASMGMGGGYVPMVVDPIPLEGNGSRESHRGKGYGDPGDPSFTLNSIEHHGVAMVFENHSQDSRYKQFGEICETVSAKYGTGGNNQPLVTYSSEAYDEWKTNDCGSSLKASGGVYGGGSESLVCGKTVGCLTARMYITNPAVRRLTPLECERLQGFPSKKMVDVSQMTKDEYIAWNLAVKNIIADASSGKVYSTRGPGGCQYKEPKELKGTEINGYHVVSIRNGATKLQCRVHRIIWISVNGIIPNGYVIDHINNNKMDNRIDNLQLLTPSENSGKAKEDGLYKSGWDNKATKIDPDLKDEIAFLYEYSEMTMRDLADLYGVSKSRIGQIIHEVGWTDIGEWVDSKGKKHKEADSPRYKALGNSIALPFWKWLARRICAQYERQVTMASLFDGIGGFPLAFQAARAIPVWASEIEEFPIAVTKKHFGEE